MEEATSNNRDEAMARLKELVLDHLGIPRPGFSKHLQELQDNLLPCFLRTCRLAWLAASPMVLLNDPIYQSLHQETETNPNEMRQLNDILEEIGVHELLGDLADSPDVNVVSELPLDPYEARLLKSAGHPKPETAVLKFLHFAAKDLAVLASARKVLEEAETVSLTAHSSITDIINQQQVPPIEVETETKQPKRRKLFSGLGKLFSGLVLLSGNAIVIPAVTLGSLMALPVLGSLAGGIAAVGEGIGQLRGEG